uniref:Homeobox-leucine zipper protein 1 n=1 Tax=Eriobotrya japonica TaxID=32224 RepID=A0A4D6U3E4_9ROSA|nr:homeobox-leucine zipper protein 1 [Eriobotrya japonica]
MELCLSLGGRDEPAERSDQNTTKTTEFCMSLSIGPSCAAGTTSTPHPHPRHEAAAADKKQDDDDGDHIHVDDHVPLQLDLLLWPTPPCNQIQNAGVLSMNVINKAQEVLAAASSSHTNSGSSSFHIMDIGLCSNNNHSKGSAGDGLNNNYHNVYNYKRRAHSAEGQGDDEGERASNSRVGSDDEEDDIINGNTNTSRKKLRLSKEQSAFLEESFKEHHTLNPKQKLALAKQLNLRPRQVEVWFQNRRARTKLKQTEVDCEFLKRCCETLTEENRRLNKELQELRALKATHHSNPFYKQSPATTLTLCPSCERTATTSNASINTTNNTYNNNNHNKVTSVSTTKVQPAKFPLNRPSFYPFFQPKSHPSSAAS